MRVALDRTKPASRHSDRFLAQVGTLASVCFAAGGTLGLLLLLRRLGAGTQPVATPRNILLHYVFPFAIAASLFGAMRLKPLHRIRCLTSCVALGIAAYAVEITVTILFGTTRPLPAMNRLSSVRNKQAYADALTRTFGNHIDTRDAAQTLARLHASGVEAIPVVAPSNTLFVEGADGAITSSIRVDGVEVMPLAGVSGKDTLLCNETGEWVAYRADHRGFNNPDEVWQHNVEIAALGDSFTHGYCVPPGESFVDLIRQRHRETLNLGLAGDGPLLMLATLSEYLPQLHPRVVLWFYFEGNDLEDLQRERRSSILDRYLNDAFVQEGLSRQQEIDRAILAEIPGMMALAAQRARERPLNTTIYYFLSVLKLTELRQALGLLSGPDAREREAAEDFQGMNFEVFRAVLSHAKRRVESWGGELRFVYLPDWERYTTRYRSLGDTRRTDVLKAVADLGLSLIDVEPAFRAHGDPLSLFPFRQLGHYTSVGHQLVADTVLRHLTANSALPPTPTSDGGFSLSASQAQPERQEGHRSRF